ncbi:hypothetical protein [Nonomuraea cavernae]|uniref:Uncharacterized protein n=1 Tax=Nonomuraea cavernae TaxID=2045107 RepID=A0A918DQR1_9ACTN|nr:hypothetical protein [Nonomuraea cavernae]MCA2187580.1 hypothetical protein [Nonomuraea cavernae]GGO80307.1 hypothetical protein GCM10012289_66670 [Nonomuraea cavernae]
MKRIVTILVAVAALAAGALPVSAAGNWAVTYLDPMPERFAPGTTYTLGFWVLQHGSHPYEGDLGETGLRLTGDGGKELTFRGTPLPERGHYVTAIAVPEGSWRVEGVQGRFEPYLVGTLSVPGGLEVRPVTGDVVMRVGKDYWGDIRPPGFSRDGQPPKAAAVPSAGTQATAPAAGPAAPPATAPAAPAVAASPPGGQSGVPGYALLIAAAGGALLALAASRLSRRGRREPEPPVDERRDTLAFPG